MGCSSEGGSVVGETAGRLEALGHRVEEGGPDTRPFRKAQETIVAAGTASYDIADPSVLDPLNAWLVEESLKLTAADFDPVFLHDARERMRTDGWECDTVLHDILTGPVPPGGFEAAYSLDVFEHIVQLVQVFMAIRDNGFIPILVVGCIAEGGLIVFNHAGIQQVVIDVLISLLVLLAVLTARGYLLLRRPTADPFARAEQVQS